MAQIRLVGKWRSPVNNHKNSWTPERREAAAERCRRHKPSQYIKCQKAPIKHRSQDAHLISAIRHGLTSKDPMIRAIARFNVITVEALHALEQIEKEAPKNPKYELLLNHTDFCSLVKELREQQNG